MDIGGYLHEVIAKFNTNQATEHSYRPALEVLFKSIDPSLTVINEPKKSEAGMPDFVFQQNDLPIGWCEAKDIDKDIIRLKGYSKEQRKRYERAYPNLIYTNGVDFEFIRDGESVHLVSIADFVMGLQPNPDKFGELERQLKAFAGRQTITVRSSKKLAELMAAKAAIIKDEIGIALKEDPNFRSGLGGQFKSFQANLLPNLTPGEFADIYAETITYGMFAARFHDETPEDFSRHEALELLPASNPFLKGLFEYIAGPQLPDRLRYIVDDLVALMRASNPHDLFEDFGKFTARNDPFIHFYEDFLAAYNPDKRKSRGVWYTPEPVVDFIVRAVDDVLKTEFGLADGLADTSKVTIDWDTGTPLTRKKDGRAFKTGETEKIKKEVHRVQILDPATGTGTFLAKAVQLISDRVKTRAPAVWSSYVEQDLLPRLHGFELLMASYAMCHLKLDMQLSETGYKPSKKAPRLSVWLTNALEPAEEDIRELFFQPLADEARGAADVKRQTPIMCIIGNPPYSGESANKGKHIMDLMEAYKKEPGGKEKLKERNPKWINDDYVKFIRMSEDLIAKNPSGGILGFITNHGYLDNPTFRGMRWHLLKTFDKIWVIDLHGGSRKKEVSPDGSTDDNVFDIETGVALIIAARKGESSPELAEIWHGELWGKRKVKSEALFTAQPNKLTTNRLPHKVPQYPLVARDFALEEAYTVGISVQELMPINSVGIVTARDALTIDIDRATLWRRVEDFTTLEPEELRSKFALGRDVQDWSVANAKADVVENFSDKHLVQLAYRPFDTRWTYYTGTSRGFQCRPRERVMRHAIEKKNIAFGFTRTIEGGREFADIFCFFAPITHHTVSIKEVNSFAPLYLYPDTAADQPDAFAPTQRTLNFDPKLYGKICKAAGIDPVDTAGPDEDFRALSGNARPSEVKVFDYICGVLHAPNYRETYAEFLKIDFPRVPYPASPEVFAHVSEKGEALRRLHLMEEAAIGAAPYPFLGTAPEDLEIGEVAAKHPRFHEGRVYINGKGTEGQYFDDVPELAWNFYIGGYQPAQKWLKDRKGRTLSFDDIGHYQKIIKILFETDRIMKEIELPL